PSPRATRDRLGAEHHTLPRMTGTTRCRPCSGGACWHVLRTLFLCLLACASVAFVSVMALTRRASSPSSPGDSSTPVVKGHPSSLNSSSNNVETICWETRGLYERDCFHAEPLTLQPYPLTVKMLERASSRYTTTGLSLNRAFQRARKRGVLEVLVVGGSVTYGHGCVSPEGLTDMECAWPSRLQRWFHERIVEDFTVEVINAATPAYTMLDLLHNDLLNTFPEDLEVDLIIVDYGVNDAIIEQFHFDINNVKLAHEVFIRHVINDMIHMPA
ncbi:unnamed protein product, partial [Laminaria digitata]